MMKHNTYYTVNQHISCEAFYKPVHVTIESVNLDEIRELMLEDGWYGLTVELFEDGVLINGAYDGNEVDDDMCGFLDENGVDELLDEYLPDGLHLEELHCWGDEWDDILEKFGVSRW